MNFFVASAYGGTENNYEVMKDKYDDLIDEVPSVLPAPSPPPFQQIQVTDAVLQTVSKTVSAKRVECFDKDKNPIGYFHVRRQWKKGIMVEDEHIADYEPVTVIEGSSWSAQLCYFAFEVAMKEGHRLVHFINTPLQIQTKNGEKNFYFEGQEHPFKPDPSIGDYASLRAKYKDLAPDPFPEVLAPVE